MKIKWLVGFTSILLMLSLPVYAHSGLDTEQGFIDGFLHPLMGIDHLLVMLGIGLWAAKLGGKALWFVPVSFLLAMAAGAGLANLGLTISSAETWVALSVIALGLLVWKNKLMSLQCSVILAAGFALTHGYVHAAELQGDADVLSYASGFLLTTAVLHGVGVLVGLSKMIKLDIIKSAFGLFCTIVGAVLLLSF
ncbi:MAG: HupE/UreJ family protein [Methylococcales bacterium]